MIGIETRQMTRTEMCADEAHTAGRCTRRALVIGHEGNGRTSQAAARIQVVLAEARTIQRFRRRCRGQGARGACRAAGLAGEQPNLPAWPRAVRGRSPNAVARDAPKGSASLGGTIGGGGWSRAFICLPWEGGRCCNWAAMGAAGSQTCRSRCPCGSTCWCKRRFQPGSVRHCRQHP